MAGGAQRRFFSQTVRLLKSKSKSNHKVLVDDAQLKETLKYIIEDKRVLPGGLRSLLPGSLEGTDEDVQKHSERLASLLNATLPTVSDKKRQVESHYDLLFGQLKNMVEESLHDTGKSSHNRTLSAHNQMNKSETLFNRLILLLLTGGDTVSTKSIAELILSPDFKEYSKVWDNIKLFPESKRLDISILLYYSSKNKNIMDAYEEEWISRYHDLNVITQRLFWRFMDPLGKVSECCERIRYWQPRDTIVMYQSLYSTAHFLPTEFHYVDNLQLSNNQIFFIKALRFLAQYRQRSLLQVPREPVNATTKQTKTAKNWASDIVKLSIQNKLSLDKRLKDDSEMVPVYSYRFLRALDVNLQEICGLDSLNDENLAHLQADLNTLLTSLHEEEQTLKSHMSLFFV